MFIVPHLGYHLDRDQGNDHILVDRSSVVPDIRGSNVQVVCVDSYSTGI